LFRIYSPFLYPKNCREELNQMFSRKRWILTVSHLFSLFVSKKLSGRVESNVF
ncbi:hypothetical protein T02_2019, partial [Trichinella nativa]